MRLFIFLLALSQVTPLSPADQAVLASLRQAVVGLENGIISPKQFERQCPRSSIATWQRIQRRIPSTRSGSADLAFVSAYYGVDYSQNLRRLLIPYRRWIRARQERKNPTGQHDMAVVEALPADLSILFRKRHDAASLGALLDLQLDDDENAMGQQMDVLQHLWPENQETILRSASGSDTRIWNVAEMLDAFYASEAGGQAIRAELRRFAAHPDRRVAEAAKDILEMFRPKPKRRTGRP